MPRLGLGPDRGAAHGHEFAEAYLAQVQDTLGILTLDDGDGGSLGTSLPPGPSVKAIDMGTQWAVGPRDPAGSAVDVSDRALLCMNVSADGELAVVGGADHGLKEVGVRDARIQRELFSRTDGHRDWVSCARLLPDGRILSGGVDAKLCLWAANARPARCADLEGHTGSIAQVRASGDGSVALSASYDKTVRAWDLTRGGAGVGVLRGHTAPVMHLVWQGDLLSSGDRSGHVVAWDLARGKPLQAPIAAHRGHVTAMDAAGSANPQSFVSGGHDGSVRLWDVRTNKAAMEARGLHTGAVNELSWHALPSGADLLVTAGADSQLRVLEPRKGLAILNTAGGHRDFIYSLHTAGPFAFSGGGNGMLVVHEIQTGRCLYALGANRAAVRCIHATRSVLIAAGDDGGVMIYEFESAGPSPRKSAINLSRQQPRAGSSREARRPSSSSSLAVGATSNFVHSPGATETQHRLGSSSRSTGGVTASRNAQAYADKRKVAVEHAAQIREQRRARRPTEDSNYPTETSSNYPSENNQYSLQRPADGAGGGGPNNDALDTFCASSWVGPGGDVPSQRREGGTAGSVPGVVASAQMSEIDRLQAMGDAKFGKPRHR